MAKPDRALMLEILKRAETAYPKRYEFGTTLTADHDQQTIDSTLGYLEEHGLIIVSKERKAIWEEGTNKILGLNINYDVTNTAAGMDYLTDDGGLTAELNAVTVRIEADTIRALVLAQVEVSEGSRHQKNLLREQFEALPEEGLRHLTKQLIDAGLKAAPQTIQWLQTLIQAG